METDCAVVESVSIEVSLAACFRDICCLDLMLIIRQLTFAKIVVHDDLRVIFFCL